MTTKPDLPLTGIRVAEFGQFIAGPGAGMMLADLGADVVKVEALRGEDAVQLHGAIGMTDEMEVGHCYKRLAAHANLFGDADWHLARLDALETACNTV